MTVGRVIDISSNNHPGGAGINWAQVKGAGVTTVIIKATQGTTYTNPYFHQDLAGAVGVGLQVCAYHFAEFTNVQAEADYFMSVAGGLAQALDVETSTNVAWSRAFLQALGKPRNRLLIYGSASSLVSWYQQVPAMGWVAAYQSHSPGWGVLWQFTDNASIPGISGPVDQNAWQGSEIQYDTLFGIYDPPPSPPSGITQQSSEGNDDVITVIESANDGNRHVFVYDETTQQTIHYWQDMHPVPPKTFAWNRETLPATDT